MERNHNEQQITMSIEVYNNLLGMADRKQYTTKSIERHVRKFNPFLQPEHRIKVRSFERKRTEMIRASRAMVDKNVGKTLFANVEMLGNKKGDDPVLCPVVIKCINQKDRRLVDVYPLYTHKLLRNVVTVSACSLNEKIPKDYIRGHDSYDRYMVKADGPYDIRKEVLARKEKFRENYCDPNTPKGQLYDAVEVRVDEA